MSATVHIKPSAMRCLALLQSRETVSISDFLAHGVGTCYSARVKELRDAGCVIDVHQPRDRAGCTYRLRSCPDSLRALGQSPGLVRPSVSVSAAAAVLGSHRSQAVPDGQMSLGVSA